MEAAIKENHEKSSNSGVADLLRWRARYEGARCAYSFLEQGDMQDVTYAELDARVSELASRLVERGLRGKRAILCIPTGAEFVIALYACMYASVTAVPVFTPRRMSDLARIAGIARDCGASTLVTNRASKAAIGTLNWDSYELGHLSHVAVDEPAPANLRLAREEPYREAVPALLQYTSGATGAPKGVMLSHANLLANLEAIQLAFDHDRSGRGVIWLPPYHDMGLIGGILQPLYAGIPTLLLSPARFIKNPLAWLQAIQDYGATTSGGPNFAYDLCVRRSTPATRAKLDLSHWRVAFCGAEPIRAATLERFAAAFAESGFRRSAFLPCYGLAEATLMVSGGGQRSTLSVRFDSQALTKHRALEAGDGDPSATTLVSCGRPVAETMVRIVDAATGRALPVGEIGEIWVSGPAVSGGYWNKQRESTETFGALCPDEPGVRFLRTGDLGFLHAEELFVTGRSKELIVVHGVNHYPQDIEATTQDSHVDLRKGRGVAFSVPGSSGESLIVVQELEAQAGELSPERAAELLGIISAAIAEHHGICPHEVLLVARGTLSLTSSGKLRRQEARSEYLLGNLRSLVRPPARRGERRDAQEIERTLCVELSVVLGVPLERVDPSFTFAQLGLDSVRAMEITTQVEQEFQVEIEPAVLYGNPSPRKLAQWIAESAK